MTERWRCNPYTSLAVVLLLRVVPGGSFMTRSLSRSCVEETLWPRTLCRRPSDALLNFEGLKKKHPNMTHFPDTTLEVQETESLEEDYASRPDLKKAGEIARSLAREIEEGNCLSVSLYFHVSPYYFQTFKEALQDFVEDQRDRHGDSEVRWEAHYMVGLPVELESTKYPNQHRAGRVPSRCRVLLMGTFKDDEASERSKEEVVNFRKELLARIEAHENFPSDIVEVMPMTQAVYRRVWPAGGAVKFEGEETSRESVCLLTLLQASWSSERKVRRHLDQVMAYLLDITDRSLPLASRAELLVDPSYPSVHKMWHLFPSKQTLVECLAGPYTTLLQGGSKFRARVNHVEQIFMPLAASTAPRLSQRLPRTGQLMPLVGYGTRVFRGRERKGTLSVAEGLALALKAGCRLVDCSPAYGNLAEVGFALKEAFDQAVVKRSRVFILAGVGEGKVDAASVKSDVSSTLQQLGFDHVDAALLPYPQGWDEQGQIDREKLNTLMELWRAMEDLEDQGLVRNVGVARFPLAALQALVEGPCRITPDICQVEHHPYYRDEELLGYCERKGMQVIAQSPLGRPAKSRPPGTCILDESLVLMSADALDRTPAQVVLRWAVQQGIAVVPNSLDGEHILQNAELDTFNLAPLRVAVFQEMAAIRSTHFVPSRLAEEAEKPLFTRQEVEEQGVKWFDDGTVVPRGTEVEFVDLTMDVFDRLEMGDVPQLLVQPVDVGGDFPGFDVEPVED